MVPLAKDLVGEQYACGQHDVHLLEVCAGFDHSSLLSLQVVCLFFGRQRTFPFRPECGVSSDLVGLRYFIVTEVRAQK